MNGHGDADGRRDGARGPTLDLDASVLPRMDVLPVLLAGWNTASTAEAAQSEAAVPGVRPVRTGPRSSLRSVPHEGIPGAAVVRGRMKTRTWSSMAVCSITGATYRQLDYWLRTGVVVASVEADGSGSRREFSYEDMRMVFTVMTLRSTGIGFAHARDEATMEFNRALIDMIAAVEGEWEGRVLEVSHDGPTVVSIDLGWIERELLARVLEHEGASS